MQTENGLILGYVLDGLGGGRKVNWHDVTAWSSEQGTLWVHLDIQDESAREWLKSASGLDAVTVNGLLADETRPRTVISKKGIFQVLRGVNLTPGSEPDDLVTIRIWIDEHRIITARRRFVLSEQDISNVIENGLGPKSSSEFLVMMNDTLTLHLAEVIDDIDDQVDQFEIDIVTEQSHTLRPLIADIRRQAISIRRYLAPQREALYRLYIEESKLLNNQERIIMREVTDRVVRYIEDLDSARDKASIIQEELVSRLAEQMNKQMLLLSIVAVIFMPVTFLSGLLGMNVQGIPGANNPWAFAMLCIIMASIILGTLGTFWYKKWL